ncbi:MAG: biotin--[acetyl-CoA-carboxylase] ligase [Acidobacteria bacterium]|nr:biotin--[acetyl-CoA-carboxylase] ligase [Acidobacteriota bacterium]
MLNLSLLESARRPIHYFASVDSTMRVAAELAQRGEPAGAVVIAEEQTAGRGRLGRSWFSEPETGLYFSVILRPEMAAAEAPVVTLALGLAVACAIQQTTGKACDLRWPNDVLLGGRKCAGILAEMAAEGERVRHIIAGIGVNVNHAVFPEDLAETATSLRIETGREWRRESLLAGILTESDRCMDILAKGGAAAIVELFTRGPSYATGSVRPVVDR